MYSNETERADNIYGDFKLKKNLDLHGLTLSRLTLHCHLHSLQVGNCCRNSRLVVNEDDLMWVKN